MLRSLRLLLCVIVRLFCSRRNILLENLALRQQLITLKRKHPKPRLSDFDRLFWSMVRLTWSKWKEALVIVKPETVVSWHRAGFRLYWRWRSRHLKALGRRPLRKELRDLIFRMAAENPTWGAPRIHGELLKLVLMSPNELCRDGYNGYQRILTRQSVGKHSSRIMVRP